MRRISVSDFRAELAAQGVASHEDFAFNCPMCGTIQSARDLIAAGAGKSFDDVERYLGFSCVGRWMGAPTPRKNPDGKPCDWTLGGLFSLHRLEVVDESGKAHPRFEPATPEMAKAHAAVSKEPR